ncbi:type III-B CRISPR module RAMP protein Cmr1 [Dactylosporangium sp. NPDC049525]|uniref:type III-B CRISPR module RAMP protein Cmr1 n=1 Tax=Dactylosporangium sp. NPDC049525 TaxID=3154730 RepID=UPI00343E1641
MPRWTPLHLHLVTPAFVGQPPTPGPQMFPVSSIRGVLRYWLRALAGAHIGDNLSTLARAETAVLGAANDTGQPSPILLRPAKAVTYQAPSAAHTWLPGTTASAPTGYLLGQGLYDARTRQLLRPFLAPDTDIPLRVKNLAGDEQWTLFLAALWALRTFGGIGARSRRGFGTITLPDSHTLHRAPQWITRDDDQDLPQVLHDVGEALTALAITADPGPDPAQRPRYPHFDLGDPPDWYGTVDDQLNANTPGTALAETGWALRSFRLATTSDRDDDHDDTDRPRPGEGPRNSVDYREITKPYLNTGRPGHTIPINAALGLPINYSDPAPGGGTAQRRSAVIEPLPPTQSNPNAQATMAPRPGPPNPAAMAAARAHRPAPPTAALRRASPLWLRVHHSGNRWKIRSLALYAEWLPAGASLRIRDTTSEDLRTHTRHPSTGVPIPTQDTVDDTLAAWFRWIGRP